MASDILKFEKKIDCFINQLKINNFIPHTDWYVGILKNKFSLRVSRHQHILTYAILNRTVIQNIFWGDEIFSAAKYLHININNLSEFCAGSRGNQRSWPGVEVFSYYCLGQKYRKSLL